MVKPAYKGVPCDTSGLTSSDAENSSSETASNTDSSGTSANVENVLSPEKASDEERVTEASASSADGSNWSEERSTDDSRSDSGDECKKPAKRRRLSKRIMQCIIKKEAQDTCETEQTDESELTTPQLSQNTENSEPENDYECESDASNNIGENSETLHADNSNGEESEASAEEHASYTQSDGSSKHSQDNRLSDSDDDDGDDGSNYSDKNGSSETNESDAEILYIDFKDRVFKYGVREAGDSENTDSCQSDSTNTDRESDPESPVSSALASEIPAIEETFDGCCKLYQKKYILESIEGMHKWELLSNHAEVLVNSTDILLHTHRKCDAKNVYDDIDFSGLHIPLLAIRRLRPSSTQPGKCLLRLLPQPGTKSACYYLVFRKDIDMIKFIYCATSFYEY